MHEIFFLFLLGAIVFEKDNFPSHDSIIHEEGLRDEGVLFDMHSRIFLFFFFLEGINFLLLLTLDSKQKVRGMFFFFLFFFVFDIVSLLSSYALFVKVLC